MLVGRYSVKKPDEKQLMTRWGQEYTMVHTRFLNVRLLKKQKTKTRIFVFPENKSRKQETGNKNLTKQH